MIKKKATSQKRPRNKAYKIEKTLEKALLKFFESPAYKPMSLLDICKNLEIAKELESICHEVLQSLIRKEKIHLKESKYAINTKEEITFIGIFHKHHRGFGFVQPEDLTLCPDDVFIPKHLTHNAIDGDTVRFVILNKGATQKGPDGKITKIISRAHNTLAGTVLSVDSNKKVILFCPLLGQDRYAVLDQSKQKNLKIGDRISMCIIDWGEKEGNVIVEMDKYIGHISDPSKDISAALIEFDLKHIFSKNIMEEVKQFSTKVTQSDLVDREDLRDVECITIDPDTAKDFDDALSIQKDKKGNFHLGVHIADVSHYVKPNTALDKEAGNRCNSTYFPGKCVPMLPPELSENLCSLKPKIPRLTISVLLQYDSKGILLDYKIYRSVIRSRKRYTYKEAKLILENKMKSPFAQKINEMVELCHLLKEQKAKRGCIDLALPSNVIIVDDKGVPLSTAIEQYDITHQLVEEFMLQANEMIASHLDQQKKPLTFRIHEEPDEDSLKEFAITAAAFGFKISEKPNAKELQQIFAESNGSPYSEQLAIKFIKCMKLAYYSPDNVGHFGLRLTHYCHFTSPIRRYVDLIVHRILFNEHDENKDLKSLANKCSEQERISARAENHVRLLKSLRLLNTYHLEDPSKKFDAIITKVRGQGIIFELIDFMIEGFIHISRLDDDYFIFDPKKMCLKATNHHQLRYGIGDSIKVLIDNIDFITLQSSWLLAGKQLEKKSKPKKKKFFGRRKPKSE